MSTPPVASTQRSIYRSNAGPIYPKGVRPPNFNPSPQDPREVAPYHVRYLRDRFQLTQSALAAILGLSEQSIRGWENNAPIGVPSRKLIVLMFQYPEIFNLVEKKPSKKKP